MELKTREELKKMTDKKRWEYFVKLPKNQISKALKMDIRQTSRSKEPWAYGEHWLCIARCFGYATKDDSWGELEKLLDIMFTAYIKDRSEVPNSVDFSTSEDFDRLSIL